MNQKPKALILAGTIPHIDLIKKLRRRGYETILVDYAQHPPAKQYADSHVVESALDSEKVREIAVELNASLVISVAGEGYVVACKVSQELGLPAPFDYSTALAFSNKLLMKNKMIEAGIPTAKSIVVDEGMDLGHHTLEYPVVVKPVDSYGSKGVRLSHTFDSAVDCIKRAVEFSKSRRVLIEEFKEGMEISAYGFIGMGRAHLLQVSQKFLIDSKGASVMQNVGTIAPAELSRNVQDSLDSIANDISIAFGIDNTPLLVQAIIDRQDQLWVIEIEPRLGGGLSYKAIEERTGFDLMEASIDAWLKVPTSMSYSTGTGYYMIVNLFTEPCVFGKVTGFEDLIQHGVIEEIYFNKQSGSKISSELSSSDRVAKVVIRSRDKRELNQKLKRTIAGLSVFDIHNNSVMKKDIYTQIFGQERQGT